VITRAEVEAARTRIMPYLRRTPSMRLRVPTPGGDREVLAKLELLQVTGAFKARGALNAVCLTDSATVVACSGGNHGLGVAHAAWALGKRAIIYVPSTAAAVKVEGMRRYGAEVRQPSPIMAEAFREAEAFVRETGLPMIHPYNQPDVVAGQGTLGLELLEDGPEVARWMVAVGGGGLSAGLAVALEGRAEVVPVEPEGCPGLYEAQKAHHPVDVKSEGSARNSLGAPSIGQVPWEILKSRVGPTLLVTEDHIEQAQRWLWREVKLVAEPGGAAALAALLAGAYVPPDDKPLGVVLCGANADSLPL
jgi:threonine dehydratase